ncbi:scavenger receptor cysteine-rich type 1 protein M130-like protein [Lates japonicus]|uniref:Scavenger receptor cysteine-rich type 1 protein M130-like protein n=1 Tax=Lates japonicus TaxID=270547 RepID=A0AAD3QU20_LATJO|nr:scavenger receptor cysteine-rich type 1 protein M130-like protein [Lates japonicus]
MFPWFISRSGHCAKTEGSRKQKNCIDKLILGGEGNPCEGHVKIYHNDQWGYVGDKYWNRATEDVVCRSTHCGKPVDNATENVLRPIGSKVWLNEVRCNGNENHLEECDLGPGWGISVYRKETVKKIKCSNNITISLEGSQCAGVVQYAIDGKTPSGKCQDPASVICTGHKRLQLKGDTSNVCSGQLQIEESGTWKTEKNITAQPLNEWCQRMNCGTKESSTKTKLTCTDNVTVVLKDNNKHSKCYGEVHINKNGKDYAVCGSTWSMKEAEVVCKELSCGRVIDHNPQSTSLQGIMDNVICSGSESSLWHCQAKHLEHRCSSIAYVVCSGSINARLVDGPGKCAGRVEIQYEGRWRQVRKDSQWTENNSNTVCKQMRCGKMRQSTSPGKFSQGSGDFLSKTVKCNKNATTIFECTIDSTTNRPKEEEAVGIICEHHKVIFLEGNNSCSGKVVIEHGDTSYWLSGSNNTWNSVSGKIVCQQIHCGKLVSFGTVPVEKERSIWSESYNCSDSTTTSLFECKNESSNASDPIATVTCSGNKTVSLTEKCWGNVKTTNLNQSSIVMIDTNTCTRKPAYVVCSGSVKPKFDSPRDKCVGNVVVSFEGQWLPCNKWKKMTVSETCSGIVVVHSNEKRSQVSFDGWTDTDGERLCKDLECGSVKSNQRYRPSEKHSVWGKTFNCTDKPKVTLSGKCGGAVKINELQVCDTHWNKDYSHMICQEQNCSNAVPIPTTGPQPHPATDYYHVSCDNYHHELGQCKRVKGKCAGKLVSVNCVGNVQFNTAEKCGGWIKVSYIKNTWEHVCAKELSDKFKEQLCKKLGCGGLNTTYRPIKREPDPKSSVRLECTNNHMDIRHCLTSETCEGAKAAEVFCKGYKAPRTTVPETKPVPVVPIILGVGLFLVLVILIVIFVRIYIVKKAKNAMNDPSRMLSRKEVEFESGDYEDVTSKENEMEALAHGRFRSEAEVMMETDARSTSSFPYDDIDEAAEAQLLTSQAATADGVTYEVDDPQENYDDIEASPEITQTKAEVHNSPVTTPESESAVVPPGLVPGDVDYLVPGQDG